MKNNSRCVCDCLLKTAHAFTKKVLISLCSLETVLEKSVWISAYGTKTQQDDKLFSWCLANSSYACKMTEKDRGKRVNWYVRHWSRKRKK